MLPGRLDGSCEDYEIDTPGRRIQVHERVQLSQRLFGGGFQQGKYVIHACEIQHGQYCREVERCEAKCEKAIILSPRMENDS